MNVSLLKIIRNLEDAMTRINELDDFNRFLEKTLTELTHMNPAEIRESWRIYREAQHPETPPQEAMA
jgi:hypothetical protein